MISAAVASGIGRMTALQISGGSKEHPSAAACLSLISRRFAFDGAAAALRRRYARCRQATEQKRAPSRCPSGRRLRQTAHLRATASAVRARLCQCATRHVAEQYFASPRARRASGFEHRTQRRIRATPTLRLCTTDRDFMVLCTSVGCAPFRYAPREEEECERIGK